MQRFLPERPNLDQLRHQAKELHRAAAAGDPEAMERLRAVTKTANLASAQLALAREYGFASWPRLKTEVERKVLIEEGDVEGLVRLVASHPELAREPVSSRYSPEPTATALSYVVVARFHGLSDHNRAADITRVLLEAGAHVDDQPGAEDTPLIGAASYGETEMVRVLIEAGADLEAIGHAVPDGRGTALAHAVEYGNADAADVLVEAGAIVHDIVEAAGTGDLRGFLTAETPAADQAQALRAAAVNERLTIVDQLVVTGIDVDADLGTGATALHHAAFHGKARAVRHLLDHGADPNRRDREFDSTPLGWCHHRHAELAQYGQQPGHTETEHILLPITTANQAAPQAHRY